MNIDGNRLILADLRNEFVVDVGSIIRIEAVNNYSRVFLNEGRPLLVCHVLRHFEELLREKGFVRIHRSHLVNSACILRYDKYELKIILQNCEEVQVSRRRWTHFKKNRQWSAVA